MFYKIRVSVPDLCYSVAALRCAYSATMRNCVFGAFLDPNGMHGSQNPAFRVIV